MPSKIDAVAEAISKLGNAKNEDLVKYVRDKYMMDVAKNFSVVKGNARKKLGLPPMRGNSAVMGKKGAKGPKAAAAKAAAPTAPAAPAAPASLAAPAKSASRRDVISLEDIRQLRDLADKLGNMEQVRKLAEALGG